MKKLIIAISSLAVLAGCGSVNVAVPKGVTVEINGEEIKGGEEGVCHEVGYSLWFFGDDEVVVKAGEKTEEPVKVGDKDYIIQGGKAVEAADNADYEAICGDGKKDDEDPKDAKDADDKDGKTQGAAVQGKAAGGEKCKTFSFIIGENTPCEKSDSCPAVAQSWVAQRPQYDCKITSKKAEADATEKCPPKTDIVYTCTNKTDASKKLEAILREYSN